MKYLFLLFFLFSCGSKVEKKTIDDGVVKSITKYKIFPTKELVKKTNGYSTSLGSGLFFLGKEKNGDLIFYTISDRGPNAPFKEKNLTKVIFFAPRYTPYVSKVRVSQEGAEIVEFFPILKLDGSYFTGMPTNGVEGPSFYRSPVDNQIKDITSYERGMDSESIAIDKNGDIWIGEEYDPAIIKVDRKTKKAVKILKPGKGLPEFTKYRQVNRGFEAITFAPNGKLYAFLEGALDYKGQAKHGKFIRLLEIDPETYEYKVFAYEFDKDIYETPRKIKIGDIAAINNDEFLIVEQGKTTFGKVRNIIKKINISNATDIGKLNNVPTLDYIGLPKNINSIQKETVLDINQYGWDEAKLEGLSIIDSSTIAVTNDNDFGVDRVECKTEKCMSYKTVMLEDKKHTDLWVISLNKPLN